MLMQLLREIHRLRKHIRDSQAEIDRAPKVHKAHQTKLATTEKALADAKEALKKAKVLQMDLEGRVKTSSTSLAKYEKQLDTLADPKVIEGKNTEIKNTKALIGQLEEEILVAMVDIEERTAKLPDLEAAVVKGKADFATFEKEATERLARLKEEVTTAQTALKAAELTIPEPIRNHYDRLIKAYSADGLAAVDGNSCSHCHGSITGQMKHDLQADNFLCCQICGRGLYLV